MAGVWWGPNGPVDQWGRPVPPGALGRPSPGPVRPVVAEMRAEARRTTVLTAVALAVAVGGLVVAGMAATALLAFAVFPWGLVLIGAPLAGGWRRQSEDRTFFRPQRLGNMRPLPGPRSLDDGASTRPPVGLAWRYLAPAIVLPLVGIVVLVLTSGSVGSPRPLVDPFTLPVAGLVCVVVGLGHGLMGVVVVVELRRVARHWAAWEEARGLLLVREPSVLPRGYAVSPVRWAHTAVWTNVARWPPGQLGVGWYWVRRDQVRAGEVG